MPTEDAYYSGHLDLSHLARAYGLLVETNDTPHRSEFEPAYEIVIELDFITEFDFT